jgi:putative ATP-binding cassette transporter
MTLTSFMMGNARGTTIIAVMAGVLAGLCNSALLALINVVLSGGSLRTPDLIWSFIGLCALMLTGRVASETLLLEVSQEAAYDLRMKLSRRILAAPLRQLEELGAHRLLATLTDDILVISNAVIMFPVLCMQVAIVVGILAYLAWLSVVSLLWVLGFMVVGIITYRIPMLKGIRELNSAREERDTMFSHMRALTQGTKELKLHRRRREAFLSDHFGKSAQTVRRHNVFGMRFYIAANSWGQILFFVLIGLLIFFVPRVNSVSLQVLTGYTITLLYMMTPLQGILNSLPELGRAKVALQKVDQLGLSLAARATESEVPIETEAPPAWQSIELAGVTHSYHMERESGNFTLGPISLTIRPGEQLFIIGGNGSGKTTLAKLLVGLYAPEAGEIRLNGQRITDENRDLYRHHFSVVFSDFYLFEKLLGIVKPELDRSAHDHLARLQLDHKVEVKGGILSTTELSHGQRKRLALLTAYLEDRPIYVFDEWAADQDPFFKETFYWQILNDLKAKGKTVIVISHDDKYFDIADRIIKLDCGKIEFDRCLTESRSTADFLVPVRL